eukprot:12401770-Karenia_brevis.AAC.1
MERMRSTENKQEPELREELNQTPDGLRSPGMSKESNSTMRKSWSIQTLRDVRKREGAPVAE